MTADNNRPVSVLEELEAMFQYEATVAKYDLGRLEENHWQRPFHEGRLVQTKAIQKRVQAILSEHLMKEITPKADGATSLP